MTFIPNWRVILRHSYSLHLNAGSLVCWLAIMLDYVWPYLADYLPFRPIVFGVLGGALAIAAIYARFVLQPAISGAPNANR
ncbi:hypothetical protein [Mesorhizobium sp.]|uniref:DUF7940 domain-containing protein n=1 Tax=Mesorhizobium sp. TaxID=1871066 RepID=UPI000FE96326|nr:hypothetical protein [Mesorhizobium sp.]RWE37476.1 MAG: hypothetical protein EOS77_02535 [Mesorhizobium sp.]